MGVRDIPRTVRIGSLVLVVMAVVAAGMAVETIGAWAHLLPAADAARAADNSSLTRQAIWEAESGLGINLIAVLATGLAGVALAALVRRPLRWAQISTIVLAVVVSAMLLCGLNSGPADGGAEYGLYPGWYPGLNALLGIAVIVLVIAAAVLLSRSSVADFYRRASRQEDDPRWSSFVDRTIES